ncbi:hypothetical protein chiPu_0004150 [Chiloscyllium punctatum]|uniref:Triple QxxK/R motif-containing protein n=2 Tax=Chiloscyllium punctatum TaxID=137246 RepID=A0A401S5S4_CHIPU|nr:hypothetical protein [Chiloscyllium punctatum]
MRGAHRIFITFAVRVSLYISNSNCCTLANLKKGRKDLHIFCATLKMGRKDAAASKIPIDHYRKQIGKQDYKKTRSVLRATRLKAEAKKTAPGIRDVALIVAAILILLVAIYGFFYLKFTTEVDLDLDLDENSEV